MAIANRAVSPMPIGFFRLLSPPNLLDLAFKIKKIKTK